MPKLGIRFKNEEHFEALRESGKRLEEVMRRVEKMIVPGASTELLDKIAEKAIQELGGETVFKGYGKEYGNPFPASICVSINDEVVHGIPRKERLLREGDLVKVDMGLRFRGMITDMARTFGVGTLSEDSKRLLWVTEESLLRGIATVRHGSKLSEYGSAVERFVESHGFSVVRDLVGHGVGFLLHEPPQIPNFSFPSSQNLLFQNGMAVALEPMINAGSSAVRLAKDGWTFVTEDHARSAHFEDTVLLSEHGVETVTRTS
ncbi:MAG: type I methionyl aminopeptidase [Candidatus Moraniibacteriota bacterium]|nr:MAG: type I methionyl aminopeptidase [Candidatus Moranbacteria bacterium]